MSFPSKAQPRSFYPPGGLDWHRMIAEAAYYRAEKRGFLGQHSLDDWLAAEQDVRQMISPMDSEATMNDTTLPGQSQRVEDTLGKNVSRLEHGQSALQRKDASHFEKFAATRAAGDGIQAHTPNKDRSVDEKIGANMADRK